MITYKQQLDADRRWAFLEGSMHFEGGSAVHKTLTKLAAKLDEIGVPYAIAGEMALFFHGYRRFTEDVDVVVTAEGLQRIHEELDGRGYVADSRECQNLRDAETGVRIIFAIAGKSSVSGASQPVFFPDPSEWRTAIGGVHVLLLESIVELKLAKGMAHPRSLGDLGDVQCAIAALALDANFAERLHHDVREKYLQLWRAVRDDPNREP
jgi:hypothetical protein